MSQYPPGMDQPVYWVTCPVCKSPSGERCVRPDGFVLPISAPHWRRRGVKWSGE